MVKKSVKFASALIIVALTLTMLLSIGALVFLVMGKLLESVQPLPFVYGFIAGFLAPIELLVNKQVGAFDYDMFSTVSIILIIALIFICIFAIKDNATLHKYPTKEKKFNYVSAVIFSFFLVAYYSFNIVMIILNYKHVATFLDANIPDLFVTISDLIGTNITVAVSFGVCGLGAVASLLCFIIYIANKQKAQKQEKEVVSLTFYSEEYLPKQQKEEVQINAEQQQEQQKQEDAEKNQNEKAKKQNERAQKLIEKVMQLNELKDQNQITEVEYTKLRQKAIRKYK